MLKKQLAMFSETQIDDEFVVMVLDSGEFLSLSGTAGSIWSLIDGTRGRDAILAALAEEYAVPSSGIERDVDEFLATLADARLVADA
ncbi:MAG: PqqD family protein [Sphingomonadaceae bacterium]|nr:PqqD family protein [Sphingomonadaceae bacterium]